MPARRTALLLVLLAVAGAALLYSPGPVASQVKRGISQKERFTANATLATGAARHLSCDDLKKFLMPGGKGPNTALAKDWSAVHRQSSGALMFMGVL
jgi:hypothetical protein